MDGNEIAIVGYGGKFPGADNCEEFWRLLKNGENHVKDIPNHRWNTDAFFHEDYNEPGKTYVRKAGLIEGHDEWDNQMFQISDVEAARMDPQQRYTLDCVHMALENGGITRNDINGTSTGVFIGVMNDDYKSATNDDLKEMNNYSLTGTAPSIIAARVSYVFNLLGPSMSIDTACSSSLVAIHLATQAIKNGDCSMAICGGVNGILYPDMFIPLTKARMVSPTGQSQAFSENADGYARGEGCGIVILMKLSEALKEGREIIASIYTGVNQDGRTTTPITAPSGQQQIALLQSVYTSHGIDPSEIDYIEAHGFCPTYLRAPFMDDRLYMSYTAMLNTSHMGECIQACSNDDVCTSFFYNYGTKQCALVEGGLSSNTATQNSPGWMYYDCYHSEYNTSTMFFFGTETVNWETAKSNCQERNAYLAEPDNEDLYNFFKEKVSKYGTTYWTGGYFTPDDNNWRWIRFNTSFKYRNWNQDYTLETPYCLVMPYQDAWLPAACHETHRYACQRDNV